MCSAVGNGVGVGGLYGSGDLAKVVCKVQRKSVCVYVERVERRCMSCESKNLIILVLDTYISDV